MKLRQRGYAILDARLWKRVHWLAPVAALDARDFKQAAWAIGLGERYREQLDTAADMVPGERSLGTYNDYLDATRTYNLPTMTRVIIEPATFNLVATCGISPDARFVK
jgi:hypothetical protein